MSVSIRKDEWLKALSEAGMSLESDDSALTVQEFAAMIGLSWHSAQRRLSKLAARGLAIRTRKVVHSSYGRRQVITAYRLLDVNPKAKKRQPS